MNENIRFHSPLQTLTESLQTSDDNSVNIRDSPLAFWMDMFDKNELMYWGGRFADQCLTTTEVNIQKMFTVNQR